MFSCDKGIKKCRAICCYYVPFKKEFWEKHKKKAVTKALVLKWDEENILPLTKNMRCPFLGRNLRCVIYKDRPGLCKVFGTVNTQGLRCYYLKTNGNKRSKKSRDKLVKQNMENLVRIKGKIENEFERIRKLKEVKNHGR